MKLIFYCILNVLSYGTDDEAFNTAINRAYKLNADVFVPSGEYVINSDIILRDGVKLIGEDIKTTIIRNINPESCSIYFDQYTQDSNINYCVENLTIIGTGHYSADYNTEPRENGIYLEGNAANKLNSVLIRNVIVKNIWGGGIQAKYAKNIIFDNCRIENCNFTGFTAIGDSINIVNCSTDLTRMIIECVSGSYYSSEKSFVRFENITGIGIINYGIKLTGGSKIEMENINITGTNILEQECYGLWLNSDSTIITDKGKVLKIDSLFIENFNINKVREGIRLDQTSYTSRAPVGFISIKDGIIQNTLLNGIRFVLNNNLGSMIIDNVKMFGINSYPAYCDGSCIRLANLNNCIVQNCAFSSVSDNEFFAMPVCVSGSQNISIQNNTIINTCIPKIWATGSTVTEMGNTGINGINYF